MEAIILMPTHPAIYTHTTAEQTLRDGLRQATAMNEVLSAQRDELATENRLLRLKVESLESQLNQPLLPPQPQ